MSDSENILWLEDFPYRDGVASVSRLKGGWRLELSGRTREARTLLTAFEALIAKPAGEQELLVTAAALAWDEAFATCLSN